MGLITETNAQYYSGQQVFSALSAITNPTFTCTFNTKVISAYNSAGAIIKDQAIIQAATSQLNQDTQNEKT